MRKWVVLLFAGIGCSSCVFDPSLGNSYGACATDEDCPAGCTCFEQSACVPTMGDDPRLCDPSVGAVTEPARLLDPAWARRVDSLVVNTALDESQIDESGSYDGANEMLLGALQDDLLSLREALLVANAWDGPIRISFDPEVFGAADAAPIVIVAELGSLPALEGEEVLIDGRGVNVSMTSGCSCEYGFLLSCRNCALVGLKIEGFLQGGIRISNADGVCVAGITVLDNDYGVMIDHSRNVLFSDGSVFALQQDPLPNRIAENPSHGVVIDASDQIVIAGTVVENNNDTGIMVGGDCGTVSIGLPPPLDGLACAPNRVICQQWGVQVVNAQVDLLIRGAEFDANYVAMRLTGTTGRVRFLHNTVHGSTHGWAKLSQAAEGELSLVVVNNIVADLNAFWFLTVYEPDSLQVEGGGLLCNQEFACSGSEELCQALGGPVEASQTGFTNTPDCPCCLQDTSPAVDAGLETDLDVNGEAPGGFNGSAPDLGAFEHP